MRVFVDAAPTACRAVPRPLLLLLVARSMQVTKATDHSLPAHSHYAALID